jgi:hypothetical protein
MAGHRPIRLLRRAGDAAGNSSCPCCPAPGESVMKIPDVSAYRSTYPQRPKMATFAARIIGFSGAFSGAPGEALIASIVLMSYTKY